MWTHVNTYTTKGEHKEPHVALPSFNSCELRTKLVLSILLYKDFKNNLSPKKGVTMCN